MNKIAVLLSAYNGNDYIEQQIESIYGQTYDQFELFIRDDGSNIDFLEKLRKLRDKFGFHLNEGKNIGFVCSFMNMLEYVEDADLYAFADQDDIWCEDKLEKAVNWHDNRGDVNVPCLFHSAYDIIDSERKRIIDNFYYPEEGYDFRRSITENHYSGFSMVINRPLRQMMLKGNPALIGYHDWWAAMIIKAFGVAYSDKHVTALHRAHGDNVTTFNLRTRVRWLKQTISEDSDIHRRCAEFKRCFGNELSDKDKAVLDMFCNEGYNFFDSLKKAFSSKRWRPQLTSEIVIRLLMLLGRI